MDQNKSALPDSRMTEDAVSWYLRIQEGISQTDFRAWRQWLAENDDNARAFDAVTEFWQQSEQLENLPWPTDLELVADTYDGSVALSVPEKSIPSLRTHKTGRRVWLAIAASIAVVSVVSVILLQRPEQMNANYRTAIAEHRVISLEDGSSITLGAQSDVSVVFDKEIRHVTLKHGEAYFKVAKDISRPFVVAAGTRTVRALGTEFNVNIGVRDIKVSVVEGRVRVEGPAPEPTDKRSGQESSTISNLEPGDVLDFNDIGDIGIVSEVDPILTASWMDRRLAYVGASLESVIADVNRYSTTELIIGDQATSTLIFTGTIFSDDIGDWLVGLEKAFPLRIVEVEGHGILLIQKNI